MSDFETSTTETDADAASAQAAESTPVMTPVSSSNVDSVGYDQKSQSLYVRFKSGGTYLYGGVPASTYQSLLTADSVGGFLHRHIKVAHAATRVG